MNIDLILSLFFYCCGCPRYLGRQQVTRVSNTQSPCLSVQWIDAAKAVHFHVSLNTLRPVLFRFSPSGARNCHTCGGVCAWRRACNVSKPSNTPRAESCCHMHAQHSTECVGACYAPAIYNGGAYSITLVRTSVRRYVPYVRKMVSGWYLLKKLMYWIHISYTGI